MRIPKVLLVLLAVVLCAGIVLAETTCPSCGAKNRDDAKFCKSCGGKLTRPEPQPTPRRPALPRVSGTASVSGNTVTISSSPSDAEVEVDGKSLGRTPLEFRGLSTGRHEYSLSKSGYRDYYGTFTVSALTGTIVVTSDPVGAEVLLDGELKGKTTEAGLTLSRVVYGRHTITARMAAYHDVVKTVELKSAVPLGVTMKLGWGRGFLRVESNPIGAKLLIDSKPEGVTPYFAELAPAKLVLTLARPGYYDWVGYTEVQYSETAFVRAGLEKIKTRKLPILLAGLAALAGGGYAAYMGETQYSLYKAETNAEALLDYRKSTQQWDMYRNVGLSAGAAIIGTWLVLRW